MKPCLDCHRLIHNKAVRCLECARRRQKLQKAENARKLSYQRRVERDKGVGQRPDWMAGMKVGRLPIKLQNVPPERLEDAIQEFLNHRWD